ncbi:MAG: hypothetical protein RL456_1899 [Pseudomonadota bacterium]|jgi:MSHA biogenesis protein MshP
MSRRPRRRQPSGARRPRGLGAIAAIVVLVVLAALAAAIVRLGVVAQAGTAREVLGARAWAAARAGSEWGLHQAFKGGWRACADETRTLDLGAAADGLRVTVRCRSRTTREGLADDGSVRTLRLYTIDAVACNGATACPDDDRATRPGYIERRRQVQAAE